MDDKNVCKEDIDYKTPKTKSKQNPFKSGFERDSIKIKAKQEEKRDGGNISPMDQLFRKTHI